MKLEELKLALLPCPFCGAKAAVKYNSSRDFVIVGCSKINGKEMLCPTPSITIYNNDGYDPKWWNRRDGQPQEEELCHQNK